MRLLVVTQVMDQRDPVLGFFHRWVEELATRVEQVTVICLKEGEHHLPENVKVYSLGKENGRQSQLTYAIRFKKLAWRLRKEYDTVFVHMNQEYILLGGWLWKLLGKRIYMWRNHYDGSRLTDIAASFCTKVFCTSRFSYTANYKNAVLMPVGVDTERFSSECGSTRLPHSILFLARIAPSKKPEVLVDALKMVKEKGITFTASFYGSPLPVDEGYYLSLKKKIGKLGLTHDVSLYPGPANADAADIYRAHQIFVNCSRSGMFDKTLFEAAASGCLVIASSEDFKTLAGEEAYFDGTAESLAARLEALLVIAARDREKKLESLAGIAAGQSLTTLMQRLSSEIGV
jgi:glycosyltransferase involved in cell wall biosynthesis